MKFSDAMKLVEDGRKVRPVKWPKGQYIYKDSVGLVNSNNNGNDYFLYATDEFEEYIEEVKLSSLKVGDKWKYKGGSLKFLILPNEMGNYSNFQRSNNDVVCQDLSSSYVDICCAEADELVVQIKD